MKITRLVIAFIGLFMTNIVLAAVEPVYFGLKGGLVSMTDSTTAIDSTTTSTNAGVLVGFNIDDLFAIEVDYSMGVSDGSITAATKIDWNVTTIGAYGVYRTPTDVYLKAKAGYISTDVDFSAPTLPNVETSGISYGVGFGFYLGETARVEVEYTTAGEVEIVTGITEDLTMVTASFIF